MAPSRTERRKEAGVYIVIMGCGRVGAMLARGLDRRGHTVVVIDTDPEAFRRLGPDFQGRTVTGVGFDRGVLVRAGIEQADGFAAVSSGDNSNILAARVVRDEYGLVNVVARIYDQGRAEIYEKLGIPAVSPIRWAAVEVMSRLVAAEVRPVWRDPSGAVVVVAPHVHPGWVGTAVGAIEAAVGARVACLLRLGLGTVPAAETLLQDGDVVYLALAEEAAESAQRILSAPPGH